MRSASPRIARNYGLLSIGFSIAGFLGPLTAGFAIDALSYRKALLVVSIGAVVSIILQRLRPDMIPRLRPHARTQANKASWISCTSVVAPDLYCERFPVGRMGSVTFYLPVYAHGIGLSASSIGMILATFAAATLCIRVFLPMMLKYRDEIRILTAAIFIASAASLLFPFFTNPWAIAGISFMLGLGLGTGQPISII